MLLSVPSVFAGATLTGGQNLAPNALLKSPNGNWQLSMQGDGNLVLYRTIDWQPLWSTNTAGQTGSWLAMQGDGNLVEYTAAGAPLWSSQTAGHSGAWLQIQDDGNLVVYSSSSTPLWATYTQQRNCNVNQWWLSTDVRWSYDWYGGSIGGIGAKYYKYYVTAGTTANYGDNTGPCNASLTVDKLELHARAFAEGYNPGTNTYVPSAIPHFIKVAYNTSSLSGNDTETAFGVSGGNGDPSFGKLCGAKAYSIATKNGSTWTSVVENGCGVGAPIGLF